MNDESKAKMNIQIPVVDISDPDAEDRIAAELVNAAIVHGFVYIRNRGIDIPIDAVDEAFALVIRLPSSVLLF
jgi:isopenicillin N synthase-like dioxygenase